ncbi:MAG: hypothetical protein Q8P08_02420 [bacterium]|nr:hypothetical protein [bacterium]
MIIGHQKQWKMLKKITEAGEFSHAFLFSGQDKIGKKKVALEWLSLVFGEDLRKGHPDLILIEPEGEESKLSSSPFIKNRGKKEIKIGQIRDLIRKLSLKPYSSPIKAALIDESHLMNQEAQTSLLKTLEEPRGRTLLILVSDSPEYLLPTITSRVQTVKFYPVRKEEIRDFVQKEKVPQEEIEEIVEVSSGKPGKVIDMLADSKKLSEFNRKIKEISKISDSSLATRFQYAKDLSEDPKEIKETLDVWLSYFRKILLLKIKDKEKSDKYSLVSLKNIINFIQETWLVISKTNVSARLALERLMLEL